MLQGEPMSGLGRTFETLHPLAGLLAGNKDGASVPQAPAAPTIDDADEAARRSADELRRRRGMAATILAGANPATSADPATATAKLLGT